MKVVIDRFEDEYAIIELDIDKFLTVPKILFPNAKEGDVISIEIDYNETKNRKESIKNLINNIFE